jgi:hypothetical protein
VGLVESVPSHPVVSVSESSCCGRFTSLVLLSIIETLTDDASLGTGFIGFGK